MEKTRSNSLKADSHREANQYEENLDREVHIESPLFTEILQENGLYPTKTPFLKKFTIFQAVSLSLYKSSNKEEELLTEAANTLRTLTAFETRLLPRRMKNFFKLEEPILGRMDALLNNPEFRKVKYTYILTPQELYDLISLTVQANVVICEIDLDGLFLVKKCFGNSFDNEIYLLAEDSCHYQPIFTKRGVKVSVKFETEALEEPRFNEDFNSKILPNLSQATISC